MRPIHLILGASLVANLLFIGGYFYTRSALERRDAPLDGSARVDELTLTSAQWSHLADLRRGLRAELRGLRNELQPLFDAALAKVRDAKPGDTSYEAAFLATGEVRRRQSLVIARELIAFREHLTPAQREIFNRHLGEWAFVEAIIGFPTENTRTPPSGPFQATSPGSNKAMP
jgi:hypothetical protein